MIEVCRIHIMKTYNKLVRDRIPEIIKRNGQECITEILSDEEYIKALDEKLREEMEEYLRCQNPEKVKKVFIVHGDYEAQLPYSEVLKKAEFKNIVIPEAGEVFQLV